MMTNRQEKLFFVYDPAQEQAATGIIMPAAFSDTEQNSSFKPYTRVENLSPSAVPTDSPLEYSPYDRYTMVVHPTGEVSSQSSENDWCIERQQALLKYWKTINPQKPLPKGLAKIESSIVLLTAPKLKLKKRQRYQVKTFP